MKMGDAIIAKEERLRKRFRKRRHLEVNNPFDHVSGLGAGRIGKNVC